MLGEHFTAFPFLHGPPTKNSTSRYDCVLIKSCIFAPKYYTDTKYDYTERLFFIQEQPFLLAESHCHGSSGRCNHRRNSLLAGSLYTSQLKGIVIDSSYVKGIPSGIILEQTPVAGARVKEGRTVYLTITTNDVPLVKIPDLIDNSSVRQAEAKLKAIGFKLTEPEYVSGEQDWVYGIKYRGRSLRTGDKVPYEALLTLSVGNTAMRDSLSMDTLNLDIDLGTPDDEPQVDDSWF